MKGYAYLDLDKNLVFKPAEYIESDNPYFFGSNAHLIVKKWKFDTDHLPSMEALYRNFTDLLISASSVRDFNIAIGFHPSMLKPPAPDASKV